MNSRNFAPFFILGLVTVYVLSCDSKKTTSGSDADSLMIQYQALVDSVDASWAVMITDDDEKHFLMKRLLLEVSYTNNYDQARFDELNKKVDELSVMRYDQETMSNSDLIDAYDSATWDLTDQIIQFAREHPRYADFPMMEELIGDINSKNNYVLMHRIHYDSWVKELNAFKESNSDVLLNQDPELEAEQMPLFQLSS